MTWNINNWIDERTFDYARSFTFEPIAHNRSRYNSEWSSLPVSATAHSNASSSGSEGRYTDISVNIAVLQLAVTQAVYSQISALYGRRSSPQRKRKIILLHFACRRRRKMYCGYARLPVCLSAAVCPQYCTDPDVAWRSGRGCPLVVRCWADLQSVHGLCCYGNITRTLVTSCFHSAI